MYKIMRPVLTKSDIKRSKKFPKRADFDPKKDMVSVLIAVVDPGTGRT